MKTLKVAALGVCALGLAALPVAGVFATTTGGPFTDTLQVTIENSCTFSRGSTAHTGGDSSKGTWGSDETADTLAGSFAAGELDSNFGKSTFNVVCNNHDGWKVTAAATALTGQTTAGENIPLGTPASDTAAWNYTSSSSDSAITGTGTFSAASQIVAQSTATTPTAGRNFDVTYAVSVDHVLSAQVYQGTIQYTFEQLPVPAQQGNEEPQNSNNSQNSPELVDAGNELGGGEQQGSGDSGNSGSGPLSMAAPSYNTTNVTNNSYNTTTTNTNTTTNMNTTGGSDAGASTNSDAGNGSGNEVQDGNAQALGVLTSSGNATKQAQAGEGSDNSGWITLGVTAGIAAVGAATGVYIYKNKEA